MMFHSSASFGRIYHAVNLYLLFFHCQEFLDLLERENKKQNLRQAIHRMKLWQTMRKCEYTPTSNRLNQRYLRWQAIEATISCRNCIASLVFYVNKNNGNKSRNLMNIYYFIFTLRQLRQDDLSILFLLLFEY